MISESLYSSIKLEFSLFSIQERFKLKKFKLDDVD